MLRILNPVHHESHDKERDEAKDNEREKVDPDEVVATSFPQVVREDRHSLRIEKLQAVIFRCHHLDQIEAILCICQPVNLNHLDIDLLES